MKSVLFSILLAHDVLLHSSSRALHASAFVAIDSPSSGASHLRGSTSRGFCVNGERSSDDSLNTLSEGDQLQSETVLSRRNFASIASATLYATAYLPRPQNANADDPSNLYYKSKADEEDPLVVFGKSLENMSADSSGGTSEVKKDASSSSLSFTDIALPSSDLSSSPQTSVGGGDLNKALREKKESQKRAIDPRTHG